MLPEIGRKGQDKLSKAKVLVIGAGGLGCPVLQYLAAAGIGTLGIIDFDIVEKSNLQRQILYGTSSLGKNKALAAKARLQDLNNTIVINAHPEKLTYKNAIKLFSSHDIIVDGSDNFSTRYLVNDASIITKKPLIYGAVYKFEGQVAVFNYKNGPSYRCLFPEPPQKGEAANCTEIGVLGVLPGIVGNIQANEVIKLILEIGNTLSGKIWCYNSFTNQVTKMTLQRNETEINSVLNRKEQFKNTNETASCMSSALDIFIDDVMKKKRVQFIDVREHGEEPRIEMSNCIKIPLSKLENSLNKIDAESEKVLFCQSGIRSRKGVAILNKNQITKCYSLKEGVSALKKMYIKNNQ